MGLTSVGVRPPVADLHLHTSASDGVLAPAELIDRVAGTTLQVIAITDHDSTDGVAGASRAAARHAGLRVIPGVELGTDDGDAEVHLLGYFIECEDAAFQAELGRLRDGRIAAAREMVGRLRSLGVGISWERVRELGGGAVGRPHIARAMIEAGHAASVQEAFKRYLGAYEVARVRRDKPTPAAGIDMIHAAGGACVLAHPQTVKGLPRIVEQLTDAGLDGIETFAPKYAGMERSRAVEIAGRHGLIATGGTDYHAQGSLDEIQPGDASVTGPPAEVAGELLAAADGWKRRRARAGARTGR